MTSLLDRHQSYFFSSSETAGVLNKSADGSTFSVHLPRPLHVPRSAQNAVLRVTSASIWNSSPNISASLGNNIFELHYVYENDMMIIVSGDITLTIPDGLYSLNALNDFINRSLSENDIPTDVVTLTGDSATQKTILTFATAGSEVDFTVVNSFREVLGFDSKVVTAVADNDSIYSDNVANFNRINQFLLSCSAISGGIPLNNRGSGLIANVPITAAPGSQINYTPFHPPHVGVGEWIGNSIDSLTFILFDQELRPVDTLSEDYSFTLDISYTIPYDHKEIRQNCV